MDANVVLNTANTIKVLTMDAVEAATCGHPGMPMGMSTAAAVLWGEFLKFDPAAPSWPDRDRFVLSAGHGSMLLYSLLHLAGSTELTMDELKRFRQWGSRTAGHPEFGEAGGIETTTGPLGQGFANAVGMALAERLLAARFDGIVDHHTFVIAGDGCLMEGISQEAISLAGHLGLSKLIVLWDDNQISIDGPTSLSTSEDHIARFKAANWATQAVDGHDPAAILAAIAAAKTSDKPSLIACRTLIGYGAPNKQGTSGVHGSALGAAEVTAARQHLNWPHAPFVIPAGIQAAWQATGARGAKSSAAWKQRLAALGNEKRALWERMQAGDLPVDYAGAFAAFKKSLADSKPKWASRQSSQEFLEVINPLVPDLIGGSADLTPSNNTRTKTLAAVKKGDFSGRYIHYGIREHGMAAAMNGIALHGGFIPYGGTFLVFTDYLRPALRLSALMQQRVVYVMTHDSIGLGEDGPTHQPVEHVASLRAIPNLLVFRPADAIETAECWDVALTTRDAPSVLALSRQALPALRVTHTDENLSKRGAYELMPADGAAKVTLIATGSEVSIALEARDILQKAGVPTRLVSAPCLDLFERQDAAYRQKVLGLNTARVAVEAGVRQGWDRWIGEKGRFVGMTGFGASAPYLDLYREFGITAAAVAQAARDALA